MAQQPLTDDQLIARYGPHLDDTPGQSDASLVTVSIPSTRTTHLPRCVRTVG